MQNPHKKVCGKKIVLCADIGTSSLKAGFINIAEECGGTRLAAFVREPYPEDIYGAVIEGRRPLKLPSLEWEDAFRRAVAALFRQSPDTLVEAVCISGNGPTLVPVTKDGQTLPPLHWFGKTNRTKPITSFFLPHVLWFMEKHPDKYENVRHIFSCQEWLSYRLGAEPVTVLPAAGYVPYYWDEAQCLETGIALEKFPPFVRLGDITGMVSAPAAADFGLPASIPIIGSGPDFIMALLGAGTVSPGMVCDRAGSSEGINVCFKKSEGTADFGRHIRVLPHAIEGLWNASVVLPESGSIFERWREEAGLADRPYDELLSTLIPSDNDISLVHPVLLKIALQVKDALAALAAAGFSINEMRLSGGQAKNARWNRFKAKITGCTLLVPEILDAELTGCAAAAMTTLGCAANLTESCRRLVNIKEQFDNS